MRPNGPTGCVECPFPFPFPRHARTAQLQRGDRPSRFTVRNEGIWVSLPPRRCEWSSASTIRETRLFVTAWLPKASTRRASRPGRVKAMLNTVVFPLTSGPDPMVSFYSPPDSENQTKSVPEVLANCPSELPLCLAGWPAVRRRPSCERASKTPCTVGSSTRCHVMRRKPASPAEAG